jgi:hypothetical protein
LRLRLYRQPSPFPEATRIDQRSIIDLKAQLLGLSERWCRPSGDTIGTNGTAWITRTIFAVDSDPTTG